MTDWFPYIKSSGERIGTINRSTVTYFIEHALSCRCAVCTKNPKLRGQISSRTDTRPIHPDNHLGAVDA